MSELPRPEIEKEITKDEAMFAYKEFIDKGIKNPDDLDLDDPEVQKANEMFYKWQKQEDQKAKDDHELKLRNELQKTMFYIDAGFTDKDYLDEVLNDLLAQYDIQKQPDNPERVKTRNLYAQAMKKINDLLKEKQV